MKFITLMLSALLIFGCTTTQDKNTKPVSAQVFPLHPAPQKEKHMAFYKAYIFSYLDTDGNQYVTEWKDTNASEYNLARFIKVVSECSKKIKLHFPQPLSTVSNINNELAYKPIALCFIKSGYQLEQSQAFPPQTIALDLSKNYSMYGKTLSAGGRVLIEAEGEALTTFLPHLKTCYNRHQYDYVSGADAQLIYIDMEPVLDNISNCLQQTGLKAHITRSQAKTKQ